MKIRSIISGIALTLLTSFSAFAVTSPPSDVSVEAIASANHPSKEWLIPYQTVSQYDHGGSWVGVQVRIKRGVFNFYHSFCGNSNPSYSYVSTDVISGVSYDRYYVTVGNCQAGQYIGTTSGYYDLINFN